MSRLHNAVVRALLSALMLVSAGEQVVEAGVAVVLVRGRRGRGRRREEQALAPQDPISDGCRQPDGYAVLCAAGRVVVGIANDFSAALSRSL